MNRCRLSTLLALLLLPGTLLGVDKPEKPAEEEPPLTLGIVGLIGGKSREPVEPVARFLSDRLDREVRIVVQPGYNDMILQLASGSMDLALLPPIVTLNVVDGLDVRPLAYGIYPDLRYSYRGVILTRKDSELKSLEDLEGKTVGFVDLFSASGYVVPKLLLEEAGIGAKSVTDAFFGDHLAAIEALDQGKVVATATYDVVFDHAGITDRSLDDYRILATSDPIPPDAILATYRVPRKLQDEIQKHLLTYYAARLENEAYRKGFYVGFVPADPSVFDALRVKYERLID